MKNNKVQTVTIRLRLKSQSATT